MSVILAHCWKNLYENFAQFLHNFDFYKNTMQNNFNRVPIRNIDLCLKTVGVNVRQKAIPIYKFYQFSTILPTVAALFFISLYIFDNRKRIHAAVLAAAYVQGTITMLSSIYIFTRNRDKIFKILTLMDKNFFTYPDEKLISVQFPGLLKEENTLKISLLIVGYECFGFFLALISPLVVYLFTGVYEAAAMYPAWFPWGEDGILVTIINTFIQCTGCVAAFWIFYVDQILITSVTVELLRQYLRLNEALTSIQLRTNLTIMKTMRRHSLIGYSFGRKYSQVYRENILHCVKHYQQLWKLFDLFEPWFSIFYSIELSLAMATLALVFYNLLTAWNPVMLLSVFGSAFNVLGNLFSRCIIGEIFAEMNTRIKDTIFYEMNWWELSTHNRKLLVIFHNMSTRIYTLKGCSIYTASYYTFSQLLRISYSYVNIIRTTLTNK